MKAVGAGASAISNATAGSGVNGKGWDSASSPPKSVDGTTQGLDGGYDAFIEKKCVFSAYLFIYLFYFCVHSLTHMSVF